MSQEWLLGLAYSVCGSVGGSDLNQFCVVWFIGSVRCVHSARGFMSCDFGFLVCVSCLIVFCVVRGLYVLVWVWMGLSGFVWVCLGLYGFVWVCLGLSAFLRVCLGFSGFVWVFLGFSGFGSSKGTLDARTCSDWHVIGETSTDHFRQL